MFNVKLLTHYARKNYLDELEKLAIETLPDNELIHDVTDSILHGGHRSKLLPFQDDLIEIINYLRTNPSDKGANIIRGGLSFLLHNYSRTKLEDDSSQTNSTRDTCSMIIKIAASAIRKDETTNFLLDTLSLTADEKELIEELFKEFCERTPYTDSELYDFTIAHIKEISCLKNSHIHKRFIHHLQILIKLGSFCQACCLIYHT